MEGLVHLTLNIMHVNIRRCDIVIYNREYIFGLPPCFWHRFPETLGISLVMDVIMVLLLR